MNSLSGFLFAQPSLIEGIARLIDFGNTLEEYNSSPSPDMADALAIASDWKVVGDDLRQAMSNYRELEEQVTDDLRNRAREELMSAK